jgi:phage tail-like protein
MKQENIKALLPSVFQRAAGQQTLMEALLGSMETLHEPDEEIIDNIDRFFDPYQAPEPFVFLLARWADLDALWNRSPEQQQFAGGVGRLRELVAAAAHLSKWRGTSKGLVEFLQTATGLEGFQIDQNVMGDDGQPRPFHIRVTIPAEAAPYRGLIDRIVDLEKPAHVTYEVAEEKPAGGPGGEDVDG